MKPNTGYKIISNKLSAELSPLEPDLSLLLQRSENGGTEEMYAAVEEYLNALVDRRMELPVPFQVLLQRLFKVSSDHFDVEPVGVVGAFLMSRVLSPLLLRLAQKLQLDAVQPLPRSVPDTKQDQLHMVEQVVDNRVFQKVARFIVSGDLEVATGAAREGAATTRARGALHLPPGDLEVQFLRESAEKIDAVANGLLRRGAGGAMSDEFASLPVPHSVAAELPERLAVSLNKFRTQSPAARRILLRAGLP
eukprot:g12192.t1